jgi:exonuclease SbcD
LEGLPLQIIAFPWISRSGMMAHLGMSAANPAEIFRQLEERLSQLLINWLEEANPDLPVVLAAHFSVQGAKFGVERAVMLGGDIVLPASLVKDPRLSYVALGHIHKPQNLNESNDPPVIYPGSIERIDFGEVNDEKYFVVAGVEAGKPTQVEWRKLEGIRPFIDRKVWLESKEGIEQRLQEALPSPEQMAGAVVRLTIEYPRDWEDLIDETALREQARDAFEFHLVKHPMIEARVRLPENESLGSKSFLELLSLYWRSVHTPEEEQEGLRKLAEEIVKEESRE